MLNPEQIDEIRKAESAATPGPWDLHSTGIAVTADSGNPMAPLSICMAYQPDNAQLIVTLRNNAQQLLDTVEYWQGYGEESLRIEEQRLDEIVKLRAEVERLTAEIDGIRRVAKDGIQSSREAMAVRSIEMACTELLSDK